MRTPLNYIAGLCIVIFAQVLTLSARLLDTSVSCDQANFILSLNFDAPFQGMVYSEEGFPSCIYVNGTMLSQNSYQLKIPLSGCNTRINSEGNYENGIIIQEQAALLQESDKKYLLACIPAAVASPLPNTIGVRSRKEEGERRDNAFSSDLASANMMVTVDFGGITVENMHTTTETIRGHMPPSIIENSASAELKYVVEIRAGHELDSPAIINALNIGDPITYVVRLQKPVSTSQLGRCWASDAKSELELADDRGCSLQPKGNIWGHFEKVENDKEVVFMNRIKAWAFPTSNEVNIFCNLRICMSRFCSFSNCSAEGKSSSLGNEASKEGHRRQRRFPQFVVEGRITRRRGLEGGDDGEVSEIEPLGGAKIRLSRAAPVSERGMVVGGTSQKTSNNNAFAISASIVPLLVLLLFVPILVIYT